MPTRIRKTWKPRDDGQFDCRVGWEVNSRGNRAQHKFRLGSDLTEAKRRDELLRQMWERIDRAKPADPVWTEDTLDLARHIARGQPHIQMQHRENEDVVVYAERVHHLRNLFPMIAILPELNYEWAFGVQLLGAMDKMAQHSEPSFEKEHEKLGETFIELMRDGLRSNGGPTLTHAGPTLHQAMRKHIVWLEHDYQHPEVGVTAWGRTQIKQVESLIAHHENLPIEQIDHNQIETMVRYWRQRPFKRGTKNPVTKKSAENYISALRNFIKWLHTSTEYEWRKPDSFDDIKTRVTKLEGERRTQIMPEQLFTLDELVLLYRYGTPLDRLLMLLGLNCGFGRAESASLLVEEIALRTRHSERHREILDFESTNTDSFIKRHRRKTDVYGEFLLFPHTVQALEWALRCRKKQPAFGPSARLLLNGRGEPYDKPTKSGNANQQVSNLFARLKKRITDDNNSITGLPFKALRKTAGGLVKRFSDGEINAVFLCHGHM